MELVNFLVDNEAVSKLCSQDGLLPVFTFIGNVISFIKIAVPIILILMGSIDLTKAVMASKDDDIKKAQSTLIKRAVIGVVIFFIPTIVTLLLNLINQDTDTPCMSCITAPGQSKCKIDLDK